MTQKEVLEKSESYTDCSMAAHGYASYEDDQINGSHGGSDYSDHAWGPVIVDAEGRRRPLISYHPSQSTGGYAVRAVETIEHVRTPVVVAEYRYVSQRGMQPPRDYVYTNPEYMDRSLGTVEPVKDYGSKIERRRSPISPVGNHPEYKYPNNHVTDGPLKDYGSINEREHSRPGPVGNRPEYEYRRNKNRGTVEPPKVYGSIKERGPSPPRPVAVHPQVVANDYEYTSPTKGVPLNSEVTNSRWSRPSSGPVGNPLVTNPPTKRPNFLPATNWRKTVAPNLTGQSGSTGYGDYNKYNNEEDWNRNRPSGNTIRDGNNKDYYQRNDGWAEPTKANKDDWEESGNKRWTTTPTYSPALSGPTNDIGKAVEMLKEAAKSVSITAAAQPRHGLTSSTPPKGNTCTETIDSKEAARRYGNLKQSPESFQEGYDYSGTIDSVEAARKYKGTTL